MQEKNLHEKYMRRCIKLSEQSLAKGENPFGCVIVRKNKVLVERENSVKKDDVTCHAEILAMRRAQQILNTSDLSDCTIYSNCEPCPMCAFIMRELKIGVVVFAISSPHMGGFTKWNILKDKGLEKFDSVFSKPPKVIIGILKKDAEEVFRKAGWTMDL